jgi:hypothetical protein
VIHARERTETGEHLSRPGIACRCHRRRDLERSPIPLSNRWANPDLPKTGPIHRAASWAGVSNATASAATKRSSPAGWTRIIRASTSTSLSVSSSGRSAKQRLTNEAVPNAIGRLNGTRMPRNGSRAVPADDSVEIHIGSGDVGVVPARIRKSAGHQSYTADATASTAAAGLGATFELPRISVSRVHPLCSDHRCACLRRR